MLSWTNSIVQPNYFHPRLLDYRDVINFISCHQILRFISADYCSSHSRGSCAEVGRPPLSVRGDQRRYVFISIALPHKSPPFYRVINQLDSRVCQTGCCSRYQNWVSDLRKTTEILCSKNLR